MKFLKYFPLFMFTLLLNFNVYATNTNVSNKVKYSTGSSKGTYKGDEIYLGGYNGQFSIGTRYNGRLAMVSFYLNTDDYNFTTNHTYTITMNMATEDWRNNFMGPQVIESNSSGTLSTSLSTSNFRFISYKQIKFNFKTDGSIPAYLFFRVYSTDYANPNGGSTAITGTNNWNLSSIYINDNVSSGGGSGGGSATPTPTPNSNQAIIDNQNKNTQDLIDNNNQNTTDIIDNNNQNTQKITDSIDNSLNTCFENLLSGYNYLYSSGTSYNGITLTTNSDKSITFSGTANSNGFVNVLQIEDADNYFSSDILSPSNVCQDTGYCLNVPDYGGFGFSVSNGILWLYTSQGISVDFTWSPMFTKTSSVPSIYVQPGQRYCNGKIDETNAKLDLINDSINNSGIDDKTGFFTGFSDDDHGLTSIITIPLTTIQQLTQTSCVALSVPIPFTNSNVPLPCMTEVYQEHIPTIFNLWQVVSFGIIAYFICIDIFKMVKGFKDPNEDKVEVLDL